MLQNTNRMIDRPKIFCITLSAIKNPETKARMTHATWASKCDNHSFISLIPYQEPSFERVEIKYKNYFNILKPENLIIDKYSKLTEKVYKTFKDVYFNLKNYDWYLKADDDTFIFDDNLRLFLADKNPNDRVTFGFIHFTKPAYLSGGAGYVMSKESFKRLGSQLITD